MAVGNLITGIAHIGLPTNDLEKTIGFYESLGFETALKTYNETAKEPVAFLRLGNLMIETFQNGRACGYAGAVDHVALKVTDIEETFQEMQKGGYKLLHQAIQFLPFWEHGVKFFMIEGPNAEKLEFCQQL